LKLRDTLLGLVVLALLAGGAFWARGRGGAEKAPAAAKSAAAAPGTPMPDVTLADGSVDLGGVRLVLSPDRPVVAFAKTRFRARAEAKGAPVPLEEGRLSFEMSMPMGENRYTLVAAGGGWQEAEVVLPMCGSGERTWFATLEGKVAGKAVSARFRLELAPAAKPEEPAPAAR
jgi:hypothetical protein